MISYKPLNIPVSYSIASFFPKAYYQIYIPFVVYENITHLISEVATGHFFSRTRTLLGRVRRRAGVSCPQPLKVLKDQPLLKSARSQSLPFCLRPILSCPFGLRFPNVNESAVVLPLKTKPENYAFRSPARCCSHQPPHNHQAPVLACHTPAHCRAHRDLLTWGVVTDSGRQHQVAVAAAPAAATETALPACPTS